MNRPQPRDGEVAVTVYISEADVKALLTLSLERVLNNARECLEAACYDYARVGDNAQHERLEEMRDIAVDDLDCYARIFTAAVNGVAEGYRWSQLLTTLRAATPQPSTQPPAQENKP